MTFELPTQQIFSFVELAIPVGVKVLMAIVCGGIIGLERELKNKAAGVKTNILICLGSALYTIISVLMAQSFVNDTGSYHGDPARIAAQIVPGIGFIGAGSIMHARASILGLTTAATIWIVAAIGMCIGAGYPVVAFSFTVTVLFTLLAIDKFEHRFLGRFGGHALEVYYEERGTGEVRADINKALAALNIHLDDFEATRIDERKSMLRVQYTNALSTHKKFVMELWSIKGIIEVRRI